MCHWKVGLADTNAIGGAHRTYAEVLLRSCGVRKLDRSLPKVLPKALSVAEGSVAEGSEAEGFRSGISELARSKRRLSTL
jgi:hypothetical protein